MDRVGPSLDGKIALVTGASKGIGRAIARRMASAGATVVVAARTLGAPSSVTPTGNEGTLLETVAMIEQTGGRALPLQVDLGDRQDRQSLVERTVALAGGLDILVNNAGVTRDNLLVRMKEDEWAAILDTDLTSVYRLSKAVLRGMMKAQRGRIINITSVVGVTGSAGQANYAAAKAGVIGFTKSLAREVGSRNITVNAVAPGLIDTDMTRALPEAQRQAVIATIPLQRPGEPQDVAAAVAFLASPDAAYITGETLHVNGGMYMA